MKKLFEISRNERIGLMCLIIILTVFLIVSVFSPTQNSYSTITNEEVVNILDSITSEKTDTIKQAKKKKKKTKEKSPTLTISSLKEVETFE